MTSRSRRLHPPRECIAYQVDRLVALLWLDPVHRHDDASILLYLRQPLHVVFGLTRGSQERTIRLEQVEDFPPRGLHPQRLEPQQSTPDGSHRPSDALATAIAPPAARYPLHT